VSSIVHYGAIGCSVAEGTLVKVIGTPLRLRRGLDAEPCRHPGICGIVRARSCRLLRALRPAQSAVATSSSGGSRIACEGRANQHAKAHQAGRGAKARPERLLALDWQTAIGTILVDPPLTGLILGCTLHTTQAEITRTADRGPASGPAIIERLKE